jgi:hypothetical protein
VSAPVRLRGHAYFIEFVGRNGPGWGPWLVALAVAATVVVMLAVEALK